MRIRLLFAPVSCLLLVCCADSSALRWIQQPSATRNTPTIAFFQVTFDRYNTHLLETRLHAQTLEFYHHDQTWTARDIHFTRYDGNGRASVRGHAGVLLTDCEGTVFYLGKKVDCFFPHEGLRLEGRAFRWENTRALFTSDHFSPVRISDASGAVVTGVGLCVNARTKRFVFQNGVHIDVDLDSFAKTRASRYAAPNLST